MRRTRLLMLTVVSGALLPACDAVEALLAELQAPTGPRELSDEDAFKYLAKDRSVAPETDVESALLVIDSEASEAAGEKQAGGVSAKTVKFLRKNSYNRLAIQVDRFDQSTMSAAWDRAKAEPQMKSDCTDDLDADANGLYPEYLIDQIEKIPVRDQKYRGTCAAFTAIGAIEYLALNGETPGIGANPSLSTLDLSEQHFYWLSKPECQGDGCTAPFSEGSWYGAGFDGSVSAFDDDSTLSIPLEQDCPYVPSSDRTDTHVPYADTCDSGAVAVTKTGSWCGMQHIIDYLHQGYAVPYASPHSDNWENNDGLITLKDFTGGGASVHAGGHAYLIVGYKKLPAAMPASEGGLCFVIKNSWGTGWGAGGFSCMTVGWMKAVSFDGFLRIQQPVPIEVVLHDALKQSEEPPPDEAEAPIDFEDGTEGEGEDEVLPPDEGEDQRLPPIEPDLDPNGGTLVPEEEEGAEDEEAPLEDVVPEPAVDEFGDARLFGPGEVFYKVVVAEVEGELRLKGVLRDGTLTKSARVLHEGRKLLFKGDQIGEYDATKRELTLCTGEFQTLCSVRYRKATKNLYFQFRDDDLRSVQAAEIAEDKGSFRGLALGGQSLEIFVPADVTSAAFLLNPKTVLRINGGEAARVSLRNKGSENPLGFDMKLQGLQVGELLIDDLANSTICGGAFSTVCDLFGADGLDIIPSNLRNRDGK